MYLFSDKNRIDFLFSYPEYKAQGQHKYSEMQSIPLFIYLLTYYLVLNVSFSLFLWCTFLASPSSHVSAHKFLFPYPPQPVFTVVLTRASPRLCKRMGKYSFVRPLSILTIWLKKCVLKCMGPLKHIDLSMKIQSDEC